MKKITLLLAVVSLTGCSSLSGGKRSSTSQPASAPMLAQAAPAYEYQLDLEYNEGVTPFLRLVEVTDP